MAVKEATSASGRIRHLAVGERRARGSQAAGQTPPSSHSGWQPAADRPDPVGLLEEQDRAREPDLVPVRHGRMTVSPFTFYRGAATIMAADLKDTPAAGLGVQLCGDAHLSNFGAFASPERRLVFDLNDFDETLPGPFEYDVKRMAASFMIAGRNNGFAAADARAAALASVRAYREAMAGFAQMPTMDIWYAHFDEDRFTTFIQDALAEVATEKKAKKPKAKKKGQKGAREENVAKQAANRARKNLAKAHTRDSVQALSKLGELAGGQYRIVSQPPVVVPARDLAATYGLSPDDVMPMLRDQFRAYRAALAALAICFAVVSIRRADRIAREAREANVRERRNVFELGVLSKLIEICGLSPLGAGNVLAGLLRVLPDQDLPGIRAESAQGRVPYNEALKPFMPSISRRLIGA